MAPRLRLLFVWLLAWLVLNGNTVLADSNISAEYRTKAAFLFNFTKFVEWPANHFASPDSPIVIGVLGDNPFGNELEKITQGRKVNGHSVIVKELRSITEAIDVELLFVVSGSESLIAGPFRNEIRKSNILQVGETSVSKSKGDLITFNVEGDKVRFVINKTPMSESKLKISAQLQKLAAPATD